MGPRGRKFDPEWKEELDRPERRAYLDPDAILGAFGIGPGMVLADIGAGTGFFSIPAGERVGPKGRVFAMDVEPEMLRTLRERIGSARLRNVVALTSEEDRIPLPSASVDVAFLACVLHELEGPGTLRECARILRPSGRLAVVDWKKIEQDIGPPFDIRLDASQARTLLRKNGFAPIRTIDAGPYHYGIESRTLRS